VDWKEVVLVEGVERVAGPLRGAAQPVGEDVAGVAAVWLLQRKQF